MKKDTYYKQMLYHKFKCKHFSVGKIVKSDTYNWLTGESMDTYAHEGPSEESFLGNFSGSADKSYLFALKGSSKTSAKEIHTVSEAKKKDDKSKFNFNG